MGRESLGQTVKAEVEMTKQSSGSRSEAAQQAATAAAKQRQQEAAHSPASSFTSSPCPIASVVAHSRPGDRFFTSHAGSTCIHSPPAAAAEAAASSPSSSSSSSSSYALTSNCVVSSKYTLLSFLPLNLFEQFHNVANLYFLLVGVLQAIPPLSTTAGIPTMYEPLAFIVFISCLRAAKEDYDRHQADSKRNGRLLDVLTAAGWRQRRSGDLRVGDVVRVRDGEMIPADCLFLSSSHAKGHCYLDKGQLSSALTALQPVRSLPVCSPAPLVVCALLANLNGETRLEVLSSLSLTRHHYAASADESRLLSASLTLTYEQPNKHFDSFRGFLSASSGSHPVREGAVDGKALLMRETVLRNTGSVLCLVLYTGEDTKIQRSSLDGERPRLKVSRIMRTVDGLLKLMLALQVALCLLGGILAGVYHSSMAQHWYLDPGTDDYSSAVTGVLAAFTFFILLSSMLPISLIVSAELVKFTQSLFIAADVRLYSAAINRPCKVNNSGIHEDLGVVDFIFSDKTGTLTMNKMDFRYAMIAQLQPDQPHLTFGSKDTDIAKSVKLRQMQLLQQRREGEEQGGTAVLARSRFQQEDRRSWTEKERVFYPQRDERDAVQGCCARLFPAFMRACWYSGTDQQDDGTAEQQPVEQRSRRRPWRAAGDTRTRSVSPTQDSAAAAPQVKQAFSPAASASPAPSASAPPAGFSDAERDCLLSALWGRDSDAESRQAVYRYLQHMALSNTVRPYEEAGELRFQADSAEELAMVHFAHRCGFTKRSVNPTVLEVSCYDKDDLRRERKRTRREVYHHIATFGFTSKRARVSIIYQQVSGWDRAAGDEAARQRGAERLARTAEVKDSAVPPRLSEDGVTVDEVAELPGAFSLPSPLSVSGSGQGERDASLPIVVMSKGQDTAILPFLSLQQDEASLLLSLKDMSAYGLRTLVCGHSSLPLSWWTARSAQYTEAIGREQSEASEGHPDRCQHSAGGCERCQQDELFEQMEADAGLCYLGTLGLEDQLQPLVSDCIADCLQAGMRVWMITGDKLETAKHIAIACNLIDADMQPLLSSSHSSLRSLMADCSSSRLLEVTGQWADMAQDAEEVGRLFDSLDTEGAGLIRHDELRAILRTLRCSIGEDRLRAISSGQPAISRAAFLQLMQSTRLSRYEAVKYDVDSAIRLYNSISEHGLYPVSMLVDRTAFQLMFPTNKQRKEEAKQQLQQQADAAGSETQRQDGEAVASSSPSSSSPSHAPSSGVPSEDDLELLRAKFFELARRSRSVVFARAEPAMKQRMVTEVQQRMPDAVTLAIGDGANDAAMISSAHIGVGISGVEGTAATNSADYAIGSFRMLHTLLFVHGQWSYARQSRLVLFIFYKASLVAAAMFLFGFFSGFSGQQFFDDPNYEIYNVIYTALPVLALAVLDQPLPARTLQDHPVIYRSSRRQAFSPRIFMQWIVRAFLHATA